MDGDAGRSSVVGRVHGLGRHGRLGWDDSHRDRLGNGFYRRGDGDTLTDIMVWPSERHEAGENSAATASESGKA
jgi:hypothetical protein